MQLSSTIVEEIEILEDTTVITATMEYTVFQNIVGRLRQRPEEQHLKQVYFTRHYLQQLSLIQ